MLGYQSRPGPPAFPPRALDMGAAGRFRKPPGAARRSRMPYTLFVSDLHLDAARPAQAAAFAAFLRGPARAAEALYVLGDLFDAWIGDDDPPN